MAACSGNETTSNPAENDAPFSAAYVENEPAGIESDSLEGVQDRNLEITISRRNAITRAVEEASPAVVSIMATGPVQNLPLSQSDFFRYFFGGEVPWENSSMGSGFLISEDGLIVTNQHVIGRNPSEISVSMTDGSTYDAELIGSDELTDIALLKIRSEEVFPFIEMSNSDEIVVGEWSIALGNPFGLFDDGKPTVTVGVVSAINRDFRPDPNNPRTYIDMIQTDAAINR
ncbi:MAG: hypothetical protein GVY02_05995, partial [Bacteroidetes bacterium]|nr:hypothetical protein [Bacteroidota bacterium]